MEAITLKESTRLVQLEKIIKAGQKTFLEVGTALAEIRDSKLYRCDYETFADYLQENWQMGKSHGYRIIDAAETVKSLPLGDKPKIESERAARALSKVPPPKRSGVIQKIVEAGKKVTAAAIKSVAPPPKKKATPILKDGTGIEVPPEILPLWERIADAQLPITMVSQIRGILKKAQADKDILFAEVDFTDNLAKLNQVFIDLQRAKPFAVCPSCNGVKPKGCAVCTARGFVSEFYWTHNVPTETKQLTGRK